MHNHFRKILRAASCGAFRLCTGMHWGVLRYYPHVVPDDETLTRWQRSKWPEYQDWINRHSLLTVEQWLKQHDLAKKNTGNTRITIITPVFNTDPGILEECILSVRLQTSPFWELILVDDGSTKKETHAVLRSRICKDPRIRVLYPANKSSTGISAATNRGIEAARGEYIVFLDHDDRLAPEAVQTLITTIEDDPERDILYSDRDMLSPDGMRFMHLMKPDWSPDNLYAGNYIFHLMCYRLQLVVKAGGLRSEYDGSQDYDLILRCMEFNPRVKHIPRVLYHWRQHEESVAMVDGAKDYAFEAGMAALRDALQRRNIRAEVTENKSLWRGNYQIHLPLPPQDMIGHLSLPARLRPDEYTEAIMNHPVLQDPPPYLFIQSESCTPASGDSAGILASWLSLANIGMASGCLLDEEQKILYAGMIYGDRGQIVIPYAGYDAEEPGYMAVTKTARNISAPSPCCVMVRRELWQQLNGLDIRFRGPYALLDLALRAHQGQWRTVYVPLAVFSCSFSSPDNIYSRQERDAFYRKWKHRLDRGDPYYSANLRKDSINYELS